MKELLDDPEEKKDELKLEFMDTGTLFPLEFSRTIDLGSDIDLDQLLPDLD